MIAICAANIAQLVLEMFLFIHLILVLCKMNKFLKSFEKLKISEREIRVLHRSKAIFLCFTINLGLMMFIDSMYSIFSPYLWLNDILKPKKDIYDHLYDIVVQIFYFTNTAFVLVTLYALSFFQQVSKSKEA